LVHDGLKPFQMKHQSLRVHYKARLMPEFG
jgi:hypothetical protein